MEIKIIVLINSFINISKLLLLLFYNETQN